MPVSFVFVCCHLLYVADAGVSCEFRVCLFVVTCFV